MISCGQTRLLIDPLGRRRTRAALPCDAVLITHSHIDHLNRWTLKTLPRRLSLYVPRGAAEIVNNLGFAQVKEIEPGDGFSVGPLEVAVVGTKHDNGRWRKGDLPICVGYVVSYRGVAVHHAGDIDMSDFTLFEEIGKAHRIHTTLLPIGGMLPVWYYRSRQKSLDKGVHIDPDTALDIAGILDAKRMVPVHWGTLNLRLGPARAPLNRLQHVADERRLSQLVQPLEHGHSMAISTPHPSAVVPSNTDEGDHGDNKSNEDAEDSV